jgi:hypothetical protein
VATGSKLIRGILLGTVLRDECGIAIVAHRKQIQTGDIILNAASVKL